MTLRTAVLAAIATALVVAACGDGRDAVLEPTQDQPAALATSSSDHGASSEPNGSGQASSAEDAVRRQFDYMDRGQWGRRWDEMHPAQQSLITRELFVKCSPVGLEAKINRVIETFEDDVLITGTDLTVRATAVTVDFEFTQGIIADSDVDTFFVTVVHGSWRWIATEVGEVGEDCS